MRTTMWILAAVAMATGCSSNPTPANAPTASAVSPAHTLTLTGRARTVAGRAVLFATDGRRLQISIPGGAWPPGFEGRLVVVSGELQVNTSASGGADDLEIVVNAQVKLLE